MFLLKIKNIKLHMPTRPFSCSRFEPYDIRTSVRTTIPLIIILIIPLYKKEDVRHSQIFVYIYKKIQDRIQRIGYKTRYLYTFNIE